jgi:GNAT superfamily N-acetyltransferase
MTSVTLRGMTVETRTYRIAAIDPEDRTALDASYEIRRNARARDVPDLPTLCRYRHDAGFRVPWPGNLDHHWMAYDGDQPVGVLSMSLPQLDNLDNADIELVVHPRHRRRGVGRALYGYAVAQVRALGRKRLFAGTVGMIAGGPHRDTPGADFAAAMSMAPALTDIRRRLDLNTADTSGHDAMLAAAWQRADGYSLVQWGDHAPDRYVADVAYLDGRLLTDAPMGDLKWEAEKVDAARIREGEQARLKIGSRGYSTAVRHDATDRLVALTAIGLEHCNPEHGWQLITLVDPPHRGHRLGLISKIANLRYTLAAEPALKLIDTTNAESNSYMISINEQIGYRAVDSFTEWQAEF